MDSIQTLFASQTVEKLQQDPNVLAIAVGGSWLSGEIDDYSDLDLVIVTRTKVAGNLELMREYASRCGNLLTGFTGEHVGEPRVLICLFADPLLHVDMKFLVMEEAADRVETPTILFDRDGKLAALFSDSDADFPYPDYQWMEDRYWIWIHYALLKIGRGEYLEAFDFFGFLRMVVLGPLSQIRNGLLPRGVRKVETGLKASDRDALLRTVPTYDRESLLLSLRYAVALYRDLRAELFTPGIKLQSDTEAEVMRYFDSIERSA